MHLKILCWLLIVGTVNTAVAQRKMPVLKASGKQLSIRVDTTFYRDRWTIEPSAKPDPFDVTIKERPVRIAFISATDSLVRTVKAGEIVDFVVLTPAGDSAYTQIRGIKFIEPAVFDGRYMQAHRGKTFVEIPEVYELINTVFALTNVAKTNNDIVRKNTPYHQALMNHFGKYSKDAAVLVMDSLLAKDGGAYFPLKMDAYAFTFDQQGKIQQSTVYDRVSWGADNTLRNYLPLLQRFADNSKFTAFYQQQKPYYDRLIRAYRDSLDVAGMQKWLNRNFPTTHYDSFKLIFSPLVSFNQSAVWFENNGFREAQAHVNFPFPEKSDADFSAKAVNVRNGNIVFTELNHAFINPEADKSQYSKGIQEAFSQRDTWIDRKKPAGNYDNPYACFNEYMNWGLVNLRYHDYAPESERAKLIQGVETMMVGYRGFRKFDKFSQFLVTLYQKRPANATVADLYPQIVDWFVTHKQ